MPANEKIDGGPSVVFDAVALVMGKAAATKMKDDKCSQDFIFDAVAHANFIGYVPEVQPLLDAVSLSDKLDNGFFDLASTPRMNTSARVRRCGFGIAKSRNHSPIGPVCWPIGA